MLLKNIPLEEIQILSYNDLTYMILKEQKKSMTTPEIFKTICDLLGYTENDYTNKIGDYYTAISLDKRFIMLDSGEWDLRDHHSIELNVLDEALEDENEEEALEDSEEIEDILDEEILEDVDTPSIDDSLLDNDDDLDDLNLIIEEDEEEELDDGDL